MNAVNSSKDKRMYDAEMLYKAKRYGEAFECYKKLAEENFVICQTLLCYMYIVGQGVDSDLEKALYWGRKAASSNDPEAKFYLGKIYAQQNMWNEGIRYFKDAASQDYSPAIYCLYRIYWLGKVVPQNKKKAIKFLLSANNLGHLIAKRDLGILLASGEMGITEIPKGICLVISWPFVALRTVIEDKYTEKARI